MPSLRRVSIAPMMGRTDRHFRYFLRLISRHAWLYTEMVVVPALLRGDRKRLLDFDPTEHPLALQLGGSDPATLAECARMAEQWGYDEINLNIGCPSNRVTAGRFGACLMADPDLVARCVEAMRRAVSTPITVKHRIGIDDMDRYEDLSRFVRIVASGGCEVFIIHARKAWLQGISPRKNRSVPPLRHEFSHAIKRDFPHVEIVTNGGIDNLDSVAMHLGTLDGVMIGRAAYEDPYLLAGVDQRFYGDTTPPLSRPEVWERLIPYIERQIAGGGIASRITRHLFGLYRGLPGARAWRQRLSSEVGRRAI
ncbi:MAG: tRNA dihydrouridine(20/20a) synthase DusA [Alphaproteobacteria bacterium]|nr:tRNA dihydrouridine(20/20a) synthase DusA [Alphaproteobacteria bacterium]